MELYLLSAAEKINEKIISHLFWRIYLLFSLYSGNNDLNCTSRPFDSISTFSTDQNGSGCNSELPFSLFYESLLICYWFDLWGPQISLFAALYCGIKWKYILTLFLFFRNLYLPSNEACKRESCHPHLRNGFEHVAHPYFWKY